MYNLSHVKASQWNLGLTRGYNELYHEAEAVHARWEKEDLQMYKEGIF